MTTDPIPRTVVERLRCGLFQPKRPILDFKYNPILCLDDGATVGMFKYQRQQYQDASSEKESLVGPSQIGAVHSEKVTMGADNATIVAVEVRFGVGVAVIF